MMAGVPDRAAPIRAASDVLCSTFEQSSGWTMGAVADEETVSSVAALVRKLLKTPQAGVLLSAGATADDQHLACPGGGDIQEAVVFGLEVRPLCGFVRRPVRHARPSSFVEPRSPRTSFRP